MTEKSPLVSVIAICHNHEKFVIECLQSVVNQTYSNFELIIVDDFSLDQSREKILAFFQKDASVKYIFNERNLGICRSFNQALKIASGKYVIDLSTDDVFKPIKIEEQVKKFEESEVIGVVFSDAEYIDENSRSLGSLYKTSQKIPVGNVYEEVLKKSFILPSSVMMRKSILDTLGGYDETLTYEDFDFWVRSARRCQYAYIPHVLVQHRIIDGSYSTKFSQKHNLLTPSTVKVCQKALLLNETESENQALIIRLKVVLRQCVYTENFEAGKQTLMMLNKLKGNNWVTMLFSGIIFLRIPLNYLYVKYIAFKRHYRFNREFNQK